MTLSTVQKEAWVWGIALVVAVGSFAGFVGHERAIGALNARLHTLDSLRVVQVDSVATAAQVAQDAAKQAETAKTQALRQVAAGEALRKSTDSAAKAASEERDAARSILKDTLATAIALRAALAETLRLDSIADAQRVAQSSHDQRTISQLLATVHADSIALSASEQHARSLEALNATLTRELTLTKAQMPSKAGEWAIRGAALAVGVFAGRGTK